MPQLGRYGTDEVGFRRALSSTDVTACAPPCRVQTRTVKVTFEDRVHVLRTPKEGHLPVPRAMASSTSTRESFEWQFVFSGSVRDTDVEHRRFLPTEEPYRWYLCVRFRDPEDPDHRTYYLGAIHFKDRRRRRTTMHRKYPWFDWMGNRTSFSQLIRSYDDMEQDFDGELVQRGRPYNYHKRHSLVSFEEVNSLRECQFPRVSIEIENDAIKVIEVHFESESPVEQLSDIKEIRPPRGILPQSDGDDAPVTYSIELCAIPPEHRPPTST